MHLKTLSSHKLCGWKLIMKTYQFKIAFMCFEVTVDTNLYRAYNIFTSLLRNEPIFWQNLLHR